MLGNKSEAFETFCNFKAQVELQLGCSIKNIQSGWGGEYRAFTDFLTGNGIHHRISYPGSHQQNGSAEREHRHIVEIGLTLLANASMPLKFWNEAFRTSLYLIHKLPNAPLERLTPFEALFKVPPQHASLRIFGCSCFPTIRDSNKHKLQFQSIGCTFLGYSLNHKG